MKHILDYHGFMIFKVKDQEYSVKLDTPDGLIPVGGTHKTCLEAVISINRNKPMSIPEKPKSVYKILIDFFNISA